MNLVLLFDRFISKIKRSYRTYVFVKKINCPHNCVSLVGNVTLINTNIKLGKNVTVYPDVMFHGDGVIDIGDNVSIGNGTVIYVSKNAGVTIGENTNIAAGCYIIDMDHGTRIDIPISKQENVELPVIIGNDVWLSAGCKVLRGSVIHDGAVVGAGAVVKGDIAANSIAVGMPAKPKKFRN